MYLAVGFHSNVAFARRLARLVLLLALGMSLSAAAGAQTRRAVVIGIDQYAAPNDSSITAGAPEATQPEVITHAAKRDFSGPWNNLDGSVDDALSVGQVLVSRYGFKPENVHYLLGPTPADVKNIKDMPAHDAPTRANILAAIQKYLIDEAQKGDIVVFYYAGHGSQVYNSLSNKFDKQDETIVPADAYTGVWDIRDKEFSRLFNKVLDKGAVLTAIFDSCHSGSISRGFQVRPGKVRDLPADTRDAHDRPDPGPTPEEHGALIFSAALDTQWAEEAQDENGVSHGAFTLALLRALTSLPINASAKEVFLSTRSLLKSRVQGQDPVLAGTRERQASPPFGGKAAGVDGKIVVTVASVDEFGNVTLDGGLALGLAPKCEFVPAGSKTRGAQPQVHLQVLSVNGLTRSTAKVVGGNVSDIQPGQQFVLDRWVAGPGARIKVWVPPSLLSDAEVRAAAQEFLKLGNRVVWVSDPTADSPTHILAWNGTQWVLSSKLLTQDLGRTPSAQELLEKLGSAAAKPVKLFVSLPPTAELASALKSALTAGNQGIELADRPENGSYLLVGHLAGDANHLLEYAWVLPNTLNNEASITAPPHRRKGADHGAPTPPVLPVRTKWIPVGQNNDEVQHSASELHGLVQSIQRLQGWLQLPSPPDDGKFPYRLALHYTGKAVGEDCPAGEASGPNAEDGSTVHGQDCYRMILQRTEPAKTADSTRQRWVYIFGIDSDGKMSLLFPDFTHGNVDNFLPKPVAHQEDKSVPQIPVGYVLMGPPFGIDTYFMLTTDRDIADLSVFNAEGVRGRGLPEGPANPLDALLRDVNSHARAGRTASPAMTTGWTIQRISLKSEQ